MIDEFRTPLIRRHKCDTCGVIYECDLCAEYIEDVLMEGLTLTSPECMLMFLCEDCANAN